MKKKKSLEAEELLACNKERFLCTSRAARYDISISISMFISISLYIYVSVYLHLHLYLYIYVGRVIIRACTLGREYGLDMEQIKNIVMCQR